MTEVLEWRTSTFTQANCVEVAPTVTGVVVRHSRSPDGPWLHFTKAEWDAFISGANNGEFDFA